MDRTSLEGPARKLLDLAATGPGGCSASTVYGGREQILRQTLIALTAGTSLSEHESPGEATVQVLLRRVRLLAGTDSWEGRRGDLMVIPQRRHSLRAVEDTAVLLTVAQDGLTTPLPPSKPAAALASCPTATAVLACCGYGSSRTGRLWRWRQIMSRRPVRRPPISRVTFRRTG